MTLVCFSWLVAALGEDFPRVACWVLIFVSAGTLVATWAARPSLERPWSPILDAFVLGSFAIYSFIVAAWAIKHLRAAAGRPAA